MGSRKLRQGGAKSRPSKDKNQIAFDTLTPFAVSTALMQYSGCDDERFDIVFTELPFRHSGPRVRAHLRGFPTLQIEGLDEFHCRQRLCEIIASLQPLFAAIDRARKSWPALMNNPKGRQRATYYEALLKHWRTGRFKTHDSCCEDFAATFEPAPGVDLPKHETLVNWLRRPSRSRLKR